MVESGVSKLSFGEASGSGKPLVGQERSGECVYWDWHVRAAVLIDKGYVDFLNHGYLVHGWCCEDKPAPRSGDPAKSDAVEPDDGEIAAPSGKASAPAITNQDLPIPLKPTWQAAGTTI